MYFTHAVVVMIIILISSFSDDLIAADQRAVRYFRSALNACDRGMQMKMPKSRGSLRVLKSLWKRYQYNRDRALKNDETVKDSRIEYYQGKFFIEETTFSDLFQICETDFPDKVTRSETQVMQNVEERQLRQQEREAKRQTLMKKKAAAKREIILAINEHCASYLSNPSPALYENYLTAKQKALEIYPDIVKQLHQATVIDVKTGKETNASQSVKNWFNYCDAVFSHQADSSEQLPSISQLPLTSMALIEPEGPVPPHSKTSAKAADPDKDTIEESSTSPKTDSELTESEIEPEPIEAEEDDSEYAQEVEAEFQQVISKSSGDRLQILKDEGRLPDYVNDDDGDYQKANIWQYENEAESKCSIYRFEKHQLIEGKTQPGECPPFDQ